VKFDEAVKYKEALLIISFALNKKIIDKGSEDYDGNEE